MKINFFADQVISAAHLRQRPWHAERKIGEGRDAVFQKNVTFQIGKHIPGIAVIVVGLLFFFSESTVAKAVDALLRVGLRKTPGIDAKVALHLQFLEKWILSRWDRSLRLEAYGARHRRLG